MDTNNKIFNLVDNYVNNLRKEEFLNFYGNGAVLKTKTIGYSSNNKSLFVEAHLTIGDDFVDDIIDSSLCEILIGNSLKYLYPNQNVTYIITFGI